MTPEAGRAQGRALRNSGMEAAARKNRPLIDRDQLALLDAIRADPDRIATIDDATEDVGRAFTDGGKWRGSVTRELARKKLIVKVGFCPSSRPSRHVGDVRLWEGVDDEKIDAHREILRKRIASPDVEPETSKETVE